MDLKPPNRPTTTPDGAITRGDPGGGGHQERLARLLAALSEPAQDPDIVVHRIVHGGGHRTQTSDDACSPNSRCLAPLAPLHQPAAPASSAPRASAAGHCVAFDMAAWRSTPAFPRRALAPWSHATADPREWDGMGVRRYRVPWFAFAFALRSGEAGHATPVIRSGPLRRVCSPGWRMRRPVDSGEMALSGHDDGAYAAGRVTRPHCGSGDLDPGGGAFVAARHGGLDA